MPAPDATLTTIRTTLAAQLLADLPGLAGSNPNIPVAIDGMLPYAFIFSMGGRFKSVTMPGGQVMGGPAPSKYRQRVHKLGLMLLVATRGDMRGLTAIDALASGWPDLVDSFVEGHAQLGGIVQRLEALEYEPVPFTLQEGKFLGILFKLEATTMPMVQVGK